MHTQIGEINSRVRIEDRPGGLRAEDIAYILRLVREERELDRRTNEERDFRRNVSDSPVGPASAS